MTLDEACFFFFLITLWCSNFLISETEFFFSYRIHCRVRGNIFKAKCLSIVMVMGLCVLLELKLNGYCPGWGSSGAIGEQTEVEKDLGVDHS